MAFAGYSAVPPKTSAPLVTGGAADCIIVIPRNDDVLSRTAVRLQDYFQEQTGTKPPLADIAKLTDSDPHHTWIILDDTKNVGLLSKFNLKPAIPTDRDDAYHLQVIPHGTHTIVAAAGRTAAGAKFATYRFMEEMDIDHKNATISPLDITASPFFKTRSVSLFNIWRVPVAVVRQCNIESWPVDKVVRNIDTYDAFGFNAIETHDRFNESFLKAVYGITRDQWRQKVYAMADRAHLDGMTVFLRLWGDAVELPVTNLEGGYTPFGHENLPPDVPALRKRWETEIRDYASKNYASHIDHLIGHWADAGGIAPGSHATVKDAMLLHNELVKAFRAINPKIQSTFNLWGMAHPTPRRGWPGYVDEKSIADAGILPSDVAIAQTTRAHTHPYSEKITSNILESGHPAAVWSWRRADTEVRFGDAGLRIRIHDVVGDYFHNLPESARQLAWHNIERNHHGLANDVNYYIVGKLMWDPKINVDAALNKYCQLVFGKPNAAAMAEAFDTIEMARDVEKQVSKTMIADPAKGARRAADALRAVAKINLPTGFHSRLPSVTSPQEMLDQIRATLAVIAENGQIMATQLPALDAMLKSGQKEDAKKLATTLQAKSDSWFGTVAGGVEGLWLKETLASKMTTTTKVLKPKHLSGYTTYNVKSLQRQGDHTSIAATGKKPGIALLEMTSPTRHATFHFQFTSDPARKNHNGGLVVGDSAQPKDLVSCQLMIGGPFLRITGDGMKRKLRKDIPKIDITKPVDCTVTVDLDSKKITFTAAGTTLITRVKKMKSILNYGYIVDNSTASFGPIEVTTPR